MRSVPYTFNGQEYHLCMNAAALFAIYERLGDKGSVLDHIKGTGKKSFSNTCFMLAKLAEQGEMVRRYEGHDHEKFPSEQMFAAMLMPTDVAEAKDALRKAIALGFTREIDRKQKAVDLGLVELQKKTEAD